MTSLCVEEIESIEEVWGGKSFERESPVAVVSGGPLDKHDGIMGTPYNQCITKTNVHMDLVKVDVTCTINQVTTISFLESGVSSQCQRKLDCIGLFAFAGDMEDMLIIFEGATASDMMELFRQPVDMMIGDFGSVVWADLRENSARVVNMNQGVVLANNGGLGGPDIGVAVEEG